MKKIILTALTAFSISVSAQVPSYVPSSGLVGWWPLDNSPADVHTNNLGGTAFNSPSPATNRDGTPNSAYCFNGTNYIQVPNDASLSNFADMSISVWVNKSSSSVVSALVSKWYQAIACGGLGDTYGIWMSGNKPDYTNNNNVWSGFSSPYTLTSGELNTWTHIVVTSDHSSGQKMYVNGVLVATHNLTGNICATTGPLSFAVESCWHCTGLKQRYFTGCLDDIGIWNRVLSYCEIQALYRSQNLAISPDPIVSHDTLCIPPGGTGTVSVSSSVTTTFSWAGPNIIGSSSGSMITVGDTPGIYTVTSMVPEGCASTATFIVNNNCCGQLAEKIQPLNTALSGNYSNSSYFIANNITLSSNTTFQNSEFLIAPGARIIVPSGITLYLEDAHLFSCAGTRWQGIEIQDGGNIETTISNHSSLIEDAEIAIDCDAITNTHAVPLISLNRVAFNKNYIGIRLSNSTSGVTHLPVEINQCVFTSRDIPFTTFPAALSWPSLDDVSGLRAPLLSTGGLQAPYDLMGFTPTHIKGSYSNFLAPSQPGHIGIKIENIGVVTGVMPSPGVEFGSDSLNGFNLFDKLGEGIDVKDASLTTRNNVFQNMLNYNLGSVNFGGTGINHEVSDLMNARLDLRINGSAQSTDYGNRFWECFTGINTKNVFDVNIEYSLFRSTQSSLRANAYLPGSNAVVLESNRFHYIIENCEFNNISNNIDVRIQADGYDMGSGTAFGTYASQILVRKNYFGAHVNSAAAVTTEYCNKAISIDGGGASGWDIQGACTITSNKIDRAYRGIYLISTDIFPVEIGGNLIHISDDISVSPGPQYGILAHKTSDQLRIRANNVSGSGISNGDLALIHCIDNTSQSGVWTYPEVKGNNVSNAYRGFVFEGDQRDAVWFCNTLATPMTYGMSLLNHGIIGQQGDPSMESANRYTGIWTGGTNYYTETDGTSFPANSILYVYDAGTPTHFSGWGTDYVNGVTFFTDHVYDCDPGFFYEEVPGWRETQETTGIREEKNRFASTLQVYPNPSSGKVNVSGLKNVSEIKVSDLNGRIVYTTEANEASAELDLSKLPNAVYMIEVNSENHPSRYAKFIKITN